MSISMTDKELSSPSFSEYASAIQKTGKRVIQSKETFWIQYEHGAMMRMPAFSLTPPDNSEINLVFRKGQSLVASFNILPDEHHPANAWLYICSDTMYSINKLKPAGRRDVRRGLRELKILSISPEELIIHGLQAFCDTRQRNGLCDGTLENFKNRFNSLISVPGHSFLGAWKDETLVAFLSIIHVADWAEIDGSFSMNAFLKLCPNDSLIYSALQHYLKEKGCRVVSYGLSSLQSDSNAEGLHSFKVKVGFEASPVSRVFILHPLLKPFVNRLSFWGIKALLRFRPGNRLLKKAVGSMEIILGKQNSGISPTISKLD